ncbi:hypothetical protein CH370_09670 [Leptospira kmetyi]|nr:hypothetical protein CH370_09670 [Leptospira kmetyi]
MNFPCVHIADQVTQKCLDHPDPMNCPDILIIYSVQEKIYELPIRDGGKSGSKIDFCPWCGVALKPIKGNF